MRDVSARLQACGHDEVFLIAIEPRKERNARLVEARRGAENLARQWNGGGKERVISGKVTLRQRFQGL